MQIRGLIPPWCEWNIVDQDVSLYGILNRIDWQSVFRDCAEVVRVQLLCRDPSKVPYGRLFNFQVNCSSFSSRWSRIQPKMRLLVFILQVLVMAVENTIMDQGMAWILTKMVATTRSPQQTLKVVM
jgi:hypothetical protein